MGQPFRGFIRPVRAVQLRLFPPPKPLVERFGAEFFRRVPDKPGVYLMTDERERLLYVGQSINLRQRLNSYRHVQPERASRKLVRLVHQVRMITWEVFTRLEEARVRENELLRIHKPRFNSVNIHPEHYAFVGIALHGARLQVRLTKRPERESQEQLYGAFKGLHRTREGCAALLRLLFAMDRRPVTPFDYPSALLRLHASERSTLEFPARDSIVSPLTISEQLDALFSGGSDVLLQTIASVLRSDDSICPSQRTFLNLDLERLGVFYAFGPRRNREVRERFGLRVEVIAQDDLDDLLARSAVVSQRAPGPVRIEGP